MKMTYGVIMSPETFDKIKDEATIKETNGVQFMEGVMVGTHKEVEENKVIECENKTEYIQTLTLLDLKGEAIPNKIK